jgi:predicted GNAT superfamily acetyltransferase
MRDATVMSAVVVNPSKRSGEWLEPSAPALDVDVSRRLLVEIPTGFTDMQLRQHDLALAWRMTTRQIFQTYFGRGYRVVDFLIAREAGRGQYLLAQKPEP